MNVSIVRNLKILLHLKNSSKITENSFFPQPQICSNMQAFELIPSFIAIKSKILMNILYRNKFCMHELQTFKQNSSLQNEALVLFQLGNSFVGFHLYRVIYSLKVYFMCAIFSPKKCCLFWRAVLSEQTHSVS